MSLNHFEIPGVGPISLFCAPSNALPGPSITGVRFAHQLVLMGEQIPDLFRDKSVLDVGCGSGILGIVASKLGASVTFSDIEPPLVGLALANAKRNKVRATVNVGDAYEGIRNSSYDTILCNPPLVPNLNGPLGSRDLLDRVLVGSQSFLRSDGSLCYYETSNAEFSKTDQMLESLGYVVEYERSIFVCLNRPQFWPTYKKLPVASWVKAGLAIERMGLAFLQGRFRVCKLRDS